jgi:nucleotide-binding universal stress UspA family protein
MTSIRRILVAVKDPMQAHAAVDKAAQLAHAFGAELELFHSISAPLFVDADACNETAHDIERNTRSECVEHLEAIASRIRQQGLHTTVCAEWDYPVYEAIVRRARHIEADLIVASRHPRGHFASSLLRLTDW